MNALYAFPEKAKFGRVLSKSKIFSHASPSTKVKNLFVRDVDKIIWSYKLSPETINLPARDGVEEIQILTIVLRTGELKEDVLQVIDKAIPSPILFTLSFENKSRYIAAYKRPSEADKNKWVVSSYFSTDWIADTDERTPLPVVLDLGALYHSLLKSIIPITAREGESLDELVSRLDRLRILEREASIAEARLHREKQFNRKVEINAALRDLKREIEELTQ